MSSCRMSLLGESLTVELPLPDDARPRASTDIDLSAVPGAELIGRRSWMFGEGGSIELACVKAPLNHWLPGLEHAVLDGATALAREHLALRAVVSTPVKVQSAAYWASFDGVSSGAGARPVRGRHVFGFVGHSPGLALCSAVCIAGDSVGTCSRISEGLTVSGTFGAPPAPSVTVGLLLGAAEHPTVTLAFSAVLAMGAVALLLWRRPRPAH